MILHGEFTPWRKEISQCKMYLRLAMIPSDGGLIIIEITTIITVEGTAR